MTPPLLEHPLIQKYFGYHRNGSTVGPYMVAWNVLRSMQQDFSIGEKYLSWDRWSGEVTGPHTLAKDIPAEPYKQDLKLPDRFQPPPERENTLNICTCKYIHFDPCHCPCHKPPSTAGCEHGFKDKENCPIETPYPNPNPETASPCKPSHGLDSTCDQCKPKTAGCCCLGVSHDCPTCHKKPGITKCGCSCHISLGSQTHFQCDCPCQKPTPAPSAVELKVQEIADTAESIIRVANACGGKLFTKPQDILDALRELVALVRQEGKNE